MHKNNVKAYVITKNKSGICSDANYGVIISSNGKTVYRCDQLTDNIEIAQKFADMLNRSFSKNS